ncbi:MAG: SUMF1/EgtB/PvdO family nonheme iron enzyme, partial [Treponema sp.]|nr:SUMF1/EgtB/PvdO family nonheme iron enzyme [Treponema sp.]
NVEVTAKWKAISYDITVNQNSGSGSEAKPNPATVGQTVTLSHGNRAGHTPNGWTVNSPGGLTMDTATTFTMPASGVTVTANWTINKYAVTFDLQYDGKTETQQIEWGTMVTFDPPRTGFAVEGWYTDAGLVNKFASPITGAFTLYAKWVVAHPVTIIGNGGSSASAHPNPAPVGKTVTLSGGSFTGHTLNSWQAIEPPDLTITGNTFVMLDKPVTVSAVWKSNQDDFVRIPGGSFQMGSDSGNADEKPVHKVTLSSFYMGRYTVTQAEYQVVMASNPSTTKGDKRPVTNINWYDALVYANRLSVSKGLSPAYELPDKWPSPTKWSTNTAEWGTISTTANDTRWDNVRVVPGSTGYRLATEAQWEYAARGGDGSPGNFIYSGSNDINEVGWYAGNREGYYIHDVGRKKPNGLGLYDMSGNGREWIWDWGGGTYSSAAQTDPTGPSSGLAQHQYRHSARGGNYGSGISDEVRSTHRRNSFTYWREPDYVIRLVRPAP